MSNDPMVEIRTSFFIECEELLESLQDALTQMDDALDSGEQDTETINIVFRAVHSIKGGAGAFGLDSLVAFAHRYETVLDELRAGRLEVTAENMKLFFRAADCLQDHVRAARDDGQQPPASEEILAELEALTGGASDEATEVADFQPMTLSLDLGFETEQPEEPTAGGAGSVYHLIITPTADLFRSGNEPLMLLRALAELGQTKIICDRSRLPLLDEINPEQSYLSWQVDLDTGSKPEDVQEVFDFVEDVCDIQFTAGNVGAAEVILPTAQPSANETCIAPDSDLSPPSPDLPVEAENPSPVVAPQSDPAPVTQTEGDVAPPLKADTPRARPADSASSTVRVDLERIDRLVNLVGELVINQAMLAQSVEEAGLPSNSAVVSGLEAFMMLTRDIQDSVMMIRAQPVKPLFQRMARIVREASSATGKEVRFVTEGETTEVDKTVIERLADPLTHMIRNAVDHGLEPPEKRRDAGKPDEGVITLSAQHRSGRVLIEIMDDGNGINRTRVREIAVEKGLISVDAQLTDNEIDNLLFLPGFSTAREVSALSGRGVGMDVVRSSIQSLGGRIAISSEPGRGTKFSISLPLTLAVLDGMVVTVEDQTLVVPLSSIVESATITSEDMRPLGSGSSVLHIRGSFVPIYDLGVELGFRQPQFNHDGTIVLLTAQEDGKRAALMVDAILEQRQVVIKGLAQGYGDISGVAAATILGDGQIALIIDPGDLVQNSSGRTRSQDYALAG